MNEKILSELTVSGEGKIVFLILDGLGGLPYGERRETELEAAQTPNLNALAKDSICGLLDPLGPGLTPGSGPAHLALFGYDPFQYNVGRGLLSAAGVDYPLDPEDLYARVNFATLDGEGLVTDRRAGRLDTEENRRLAEVLTARVSLPGGIGFRLVTEKEHRALLVLSGKGLSPELAETDPQKTGVFPLAPRALIPEAQKTAGILTEMLGQVRTILAEEKRGNMILLRGYAKHHPFPGFRERYRLSALAISLYPMYRGIARLLGMEVLGEVSTLEEEFAALAANFEGYDFFFLHVKTPDARGEDGDYAGKVKAIEEVDRFIPEVRALNPRVLVVTGDHSTPAALKGHSWHPVPALLYSPACLPDDVSSFGERPCLKGGLGILPMKDLMALALAHAGRLAKFGA